MDETISAAEAQRRFPQILRAVRKGYSYIVTSSGKPVAKIVPVEAREVVATRARAALIARLRSQPVVDIGHWTRDALYP